MIRHFFISLALGAFGALTVTFPCASQGIYYHHVQKNYLQGFADKSTPVFAASCVYPGGKAFVILPLGVGEGRYVELYWPDSVTNDPVLNNWAEFTVSSRLELLSLLMGGPGGWRMHEEVLRDLIKAPFMLFLPSQFDAILRMKPGGRCVHLSTIGCAPDVALDDACTR
jgi:hypothetical protein